MGRISQMFWYLNAKDHPNKTQIAHHYTGISITPELKKERREHQRRLKKNKKGQP